MQPALQRLAFRTWDYAQVCQFLFSFTAFDDARLDIHQVYMRLHGYFKIVNLLASKPRGRLSLPQTTMTPPTLTCFMGRLLTSASKPPAFMSVNSTRSLRAAVTITTHPSNAGIPNGDRVDEVNYHNLGANISDAFASVTQRYIGPSSGSFAVSQTKSHGFGMIYRV